jgi:ribosomal protein S6--L-glutamate ligase
MSGRHKSTTQTSRTGVRRRTITPAAKRARICFIVEEKYQHEAMPTVVADVLASWGHDVDLLQPHASMTSLSRLATDGDDGYDGYVLKTVSEGPGLSLLEAAGTAGIATVNNYRAVRLARDKAVAAAVARFAGLPFPRTYFAARQELLRQLPPEAYPVVVKPSNGSANENVIRVDGPAQLEALDFAGRSGFLLAQPFLPNPGFDVKLYNTGERVWAVRRRSPLHPDAEVVEELMPPSPELHSLAVRVGEAFGLDIYGADVVETPRGWVLLDVNDFPSFGKVPDAPAQLARTILRVIDATRRTTPRRPRASLSFTHSFPPLSGPAGLPFSAKGATA